MSAACRHARPRGCRDCLTGIDFGDQRPAATYKQMGNGVNVGVVWHIMREHVRRDEDVLKRTKAGRQILEAVWSAPLSPDSTLAAMKSGQ